MNHSFSKLIVLALALSFVGGCGGGTRGTGIGSSTGTDGSIDTTVSIMPDSELTGVVLSSTNRIPVVGVEVTLLETGDSTLTDSDGAFSLPVIDLDSDLGTVEFDLQDLRLRTRTPIYLRDVHVEVDVDRRRIVSTNIETGVETEVDVVVVGCEQRMENSDDCKN